ncbi:MAG: biosynthetic-type acetolactate synthase large subunit [Anaerolineae bacterium]|nr:biosynthetic-type acetolactate synthase large subunit [Anaerolineae bacterium]
MRLTGGQIVWESLRREGVDVVFGVPGGAILPTFDALALGKYPIRHVLVRHEQCAAHAADGYARATGKVGVAIATSGPGATNLVTGIATAMMDSTPMVAITGQVATSFIGGDAFQETDVTGITLPITKHNYLVTDVRDLAQVFAEAFYIARSGRPGPVLIDIAKDVQQAETEFEYPDSVHLPGLMLPKPADPEAVKAAAEMINAAERPLIVAGHGVQMADATWELQQIAEKAEIPVVTTLLGIGDIPESHPLCLGMGGMHGEAYANKAIQECDVLIAVGMRFDDRLTGQLDSFAPNAKIIHFELDPAEVGKNVKPDIAVVGDAKDSLGALLPLIKERRHPAWIDLINSWREESRKRDILNFEVDELIPPFVIRQLWEATRKDDVIIVTDVGQHQMWEAQYFVHDRPFRLITSGGLGTMGFGLPAAIGAKVGKPETEVWAVVGDGGFQMTLQELGTLMQEKIAVKIAIIDNSFLGMVRQWQEFFYDRRYAGTPIMGPDYVKLAEAYNIPARCVTRNEEVADAIEEARATDGPFLIAFRVKEEVNVYPMVAPGAGVGEMLRRPEPRIAQGYSGVEPSW